MSSRIPTRLVAVAAVAATMAACTPRGKVPVYLKPAPDAPTDASVVVDERYVGRLGAFKKNALLLTVGEHRISVEKHGYFPYDRRIETDRAAVKLPVKLRKLPE